jgi:phosphoenolpyruvate carboxylase
MNYKVWHTNTLRTRKVKKLCRLEEIDFYLKVMTNMYMERICKMKRRTNKKILEENNAKLVTRGNK